MNKTIPIQRINVPLSPQRINYKEEFKNIGFPYYDIPSLDGTDYWTEHRAMQLTPQAKHELEKAGNTLHQMCMSFVDEVVSNQNFPAEFNLSDEAKKLITESYQFSKQWGFFDSFYARFDLAFRNEVDGKLTIKLIEYNADTPTSTIESSIAQKIWLTQQPEEFRQKYTQFNDIHEKLIQAWKKFITTYNEAYGEPLELIHFAGDGDLENNREDFCNLYYLAETARIAYEELKDEGKLQTNFPELNTEDRMGIIGMEDIDKDNTEGFQVITEFTDGTSSTETYHYFYDNAMAMWGNSEDNPIQAMFKLYPYEYMMNEPFFELIRQYETLWIEPAWKMLLSNKCLLVELWKRYPNHPLLLEAYYDNDDSPQLQKLLNRPHVKKARLAREGANVFIAQQENGVNKYETTTEFVDYYDNSGYIYQEYFFVAPIDGFTPIIGMWIIGNEAVGINFRDDLNPITSNDSHFVSHVVINDDSKNTK